MYRILRNNKEQGPYSLDELLQLSLRPLDLIWVEGKSAGWRYPSEIDTLRPYVPGGAEVGSSAGPPKQTPDVVSISPKQLQLNQGPEEIELTADMLEQKANAIYQRIQAYNVQCEKEAQGVQTKYARSLEDLRQDYADWLHNKKHKKTNLNSGKMAWMALGGVSTALIIFILAGRNKETPVANNSQPFTVVQTLPLSINESAAFASNAYMVSEETSILKKPSVIDLFIDSVRRVSNKSVKLEDWPVVKEPEQQKTKTVIPNKQFIDSIGLEIPATLVVKPKEPRLLHDVHLDAQYVPSENNARVKELKVTIHNNGPTDLKQVAVDVFYYKKGEHWFDKETLYFNNIGPGNKHTLTKQGNKKALKAHFQIVQVGNNQ